MSNINNLEHAHKGNYLWPTIADAVDIYLSRTGAENFESYERIWRLIHIWESTEVTLASTAIANMLFYRDANDTVLLKAREYFYGIRWNQAEEELQYFQGAQDGSIDKWISILHEISKDTTKRQRYIEDLKFFLSKKSLDLRELGQAWKKASDVPPMIFKSNEFKVIDAFRHINSFRNRFAHVPFPYNLLEELADALESVTDQLFAISPRPVSYYDRKEKWESSPLTGSFFIGKRFLHGILSEGLNQVVEKPFFVYPGNINKSKKREQERWETFKLVVFDDTLRPHLISKRKTDVAIEYIRFRAEANAVVVRQVQIDKLIKKPQPSEYSGKKRQEDNVVKETSKDIKISFSDAIEASRNGDYNTAIRFFEELKNNEPSSHLALLNLGYAQRDKAVQIDNQAETKKLLKSAIENFENVTNHKDKEYKAQAYHELSKTYYQLAKINKIPKKEADLDTARSKALEAVSLSSDPRYLAWYEYVTALKASSLE